MTTMRSSGFLNWSTSITLAVIILMIVTVPKRFPFKKPFLMSRWKDAIKGLIWNPKPSDRICSLHFHNSDFYQLGSQKRLQDDAVPSIFNNDVPELPILESSTHPQCTDLATIKSLNKNTYGKYNMENNQNTTNVSPMKTNEMTNACVIEDNITQDHYCTWSNETTSKIFMDAAEDVLQKPSNYIQLTETISQAMQVDQINNIGMNITLPTVKEQYIEHSEFLQEIHSIPTTSENNFEIDLISDHTYASSPEILKRLSIQADNKIKNLKRLLKNCQRNLQRKKNKIDSMKELMELLKQNSLLDTEAYDAIDSKFSPVSISLFKQLQKNSSKINNLPYPETLKQFSMTMNFYSPKAYRFLREHFQLPHPSTIRKWSAALNAEPGFTKESFNFLELMSQKSASPVQCCLQLDEMSIRKHVQWDGKKFIGYTDYGTGESSSDDGEYATSALVFMAVAINSHWKIPIGYFLLHGSPSWLLTSLVTEGLVRIYDSGVKCIAIVCDGLASNLTMAKKLGVNLDPVNLIPSFEHPSDEAEKVYLIIDVCHALKLLRNAWHDKKIFLESDHMTEISWNTVVKLHKIQDKEGVRAANKLTKNHINYTALKMKVSLAAQLFSASVARALFFMKVTEHEDFQNIELEATINFISTVDKGFDALNCRNPFGNLYKSALKKNNKNIWEKTLLDLKDLVLRLMDENGELLCVGERKTGFLGFAISISSILEILEIYICSNNAPLKYLLTYKLSQDHLELYFNTIRSRSGFNNNPTAGQFRSAYRKTLVTRLTPSGSGNATPLDETTVPILTTLETFNHENTNSNCDSDEPIPNLPKISKFCKNVSSYIAGWLVRSLLPKIKCSTCKASLTTEKGKAHDFEHQENYQLIDVKDNGGLIYPSPDVIKICSITEAIIKHSANQPENNANVTKRIQIEVKKQIVGSSVFQSLEQHMFEDEMSPNHHLNCMIDLVSEKYIDCRMHHLSRLQNEKLKGNAIRKKLTKLILFKGQ